AVWILPNGRARLGAFHFAKALDARLGGSSLNHGLRKKSGAGEEAVWLPPYSAPEQLAGKSADARADVFALGCLLFRCLTGHDPLLAVEGGQMPDVRSARKDVPKAVADVVRRCMLVEKTARFPTAQAVAEALEAVKAPVSGGGSSGTSRRAVLGAAGVAVAGVLGVALWPSRDIDPLHRDAPNPHSSDTATADLKDSYTRGHALLVGVSQAYDVRFYPKLKGPVSEIEAVKQRLMQTNGALWTESSIQILREEQATQKAVEDAIARIKRDAGPDDAVLIYFAGHGTPKAGTNRYFLVCADANSKDPGVAGSNGFLDKQELDFTGDGAMPAKHVLVVADCCYSGRLFAVADADRGRPKPDSARDLTKVHPHLRRRVVEFLGSSSDEPAKDAKSGELSKFCQAFLDELTPKGDGRCYVTARQMAGNIESKLVVPGAAVEQFPSYQKIAGSGQFVFFLPGK
ncbi:MAG: caspase family protein, partial [Planctomycetota bacterium]